MKRLITILTVLVLSSMAFAFDDFVFVTNNTKLDRTIEVTYTYPQSGIHYNDTRSWTITVEPGETLKFETEANLSRNGKYQISMVEREKGEIYKITSKWKGEDIVVELKDYEGDIYTNISVKEFLDEKHMVLITNTSITKQALKRGFSPVEKFPFVEYKRGLLSCYKEVKGQYIPLYQIMVSMDESWVLSQLKAN